MRSLTVSVKGNRAYRGKILKILDMKKLKWAYNEEQDEWILTECRKCGKAIDDDDIINDLCHGCGRPLDF